MPVNAARSLVGRLLLIGVFVLLLAACAGRKADRRMEAGGAAPDEPARAESRGGAGPGAYPSRPPPLEADDLDDYAGAPAQTIPDPLEGWNRFWFSFNDVIYTWCFQPLFRAYVFVTPQQMRSGLRNVMTNALFPVRFVNSLLQGKFLAAGVEMGRFVLNTTVGVGGWLNVARDKKTIVPVDPDGEDFGQTLGVWGAGPGIYLVWPFLGPSNVRDTVGRAADMLTDPVFWLPGTTPTLNTINSGIWLGLRFNAAGDTLANYDALKGIAVDPYIAMRDMFTKLRQSRIAQ
jgi:phospholipid-binding lipoprotein MlaA